MAPFQTSLTPSHKRTKSDLELEPRRASVSDTFSRAGKPSTAVDQEQQQKSQQAPLAPPKSRQRLSSDPQNLGANSLSGTANLNARSELSLNYEQTLFNQHTSRATSKTLNSSSISGVSSHFQIHNEQTIGRSTTTTAGKTATISANYSSLLNRKIGVIFLEGSYCERLVDSAADFIGGPSGGTLQAPTASALAKRCSTSAPDPELNAHFSALQLNNQLKSTNSSTAPLIGPLRNDDQEESEVSL